MTVGLKGKEKLEWIIKKMQKELRKEVGQKEEWTPTPRLIPKTEKTRDIRRQIEEVRDLLRKGQTEKKEQWMVKEIKRCKELETGRTNIRTEDLEQNTELLDRSNGLDPSKEARLP